MGHWLTVIIGSVVGCDLDHPCCSYWRWGGRYGCMVVNVDAGGCPRRSLERQHRLRGHCEGSFFNHKDIYIWFPVTYPVLYPRIQCIQAKVLLNSSHSHCQLPCINMLAWPRTVSLTTKIHRVWKTLHCRDLNITVKRYFHYSMSWYLSWQSIALYGYICVYMLQWVFRYLNGITMMFISQQIIIFHLYFVSVWQNKVVTKSVT